MSLIEEVNAVRHKVSLNIPVGARREFGEDAIRNAVEHQATTADAKSVRSILKGLAVFWRRLSGGTAVQEPKEAAR